MGQKLQRTASKLWNCALLTWMRWPNAPIKFGAWSIINFLDKIGLLFPSQPVLYCAHGSRTSSQALINFRENYEAKFPNSFPDSSVINFLLSILWMNQYSLFIMLSRKWNCSKRFVPFINFYLQSFLPNPATKAIHRSNSYFCYWVEWKYWIISPDSTFFD